MPAPRKPTYVPMESGEMVLGLVYGAGAATDPVEALLRQQLAQYDYGLTVIHLSKHFPTILGRPIDRERPESVRELQGMGDDLRKQTGLNQVLARLAAFLIGRERRTMKPRDLERHVWLVQSFKRPEEVQEMRRIYGPRFMLLGIHVPEVVRQRAQEQKWQRWAPVTSRSYQAEAATDIKRDEHDPVVAFGQAFGQTFAQADFFIDARSHRHLDETLPRAVRLLFGETFEPPHRDEQAMYHAFTAGLRSAEMGRQVGAAIVTPAGDVVTVGTNEVPSGRGGLYWSPDVPDGRDFAQRPPFDSNTLWQRRIARELLVRMSAIGWLKAGKTVRLKKGVYDISQPDLDAFLESVKGTRFADITEFGRAVHAEMDALTTAARLGRAVDGCTVMTTTYPCHGCTRHIIASGIRRVVFIHPYTKSLARDLHADAVVPEPEIRGPVRDKVVFEQYIGVAPRVYPQFFHFGQTSRKEEHPPRGKALSPDDPATAEPRPIASGGSFAWGGPAVPTEIVSKLEKVASDDFKRRVREAGLKLPA